MLKDFLPLENFRKWKIYCSTGGQDPDSFSRKKVKTMRDPNDFCIMRWRAFCLLGYLIRLMIGRLKQCKLLGESWAFAIAWKGLHSDSGFQSLKEGAAKRTPKGSLSMNYFLKINSQRASVAFWSKVAFTELQGSSLHSSKSVRLPANSAMQCSFWLLNCRTSTSFRLNGIDSIVVDA